MHTIYEVLNSYGFLKPGKIRYRLSKTKDSTLSKFFERYVKVAKDLPLAVTARPGVTDIYPDSWAPQLSMQVIQQLAIYANTIYIHDPLLKMAHEWQNFDYIDYLMTAPGPREERLLDFRDRLATTIERLLILRPLVEAGIVFVTPTTFNQFNRRSKELYVDDFYGPGGSLSEMMGDESQTDLPPQLSEYMHQHLVIHPTKYVNRELVILENETLSPRRTVALHLRDDPNPHVFNLMNVIPEEDMANTGKITMRLLFEGEDPVDSETFWSWINGIKRKVVLERLSRLQDDLVLASLAHANFITNLPVSRDLALLDLSPVQATPKPSAITGLLQLDLPFFERVKLDDIVKARQDELAFAEFRVSLEKAFEEIYKLPGSEDLQKHVDEVVRDLLLMPVMRIERQMNSLQRNLFPDSLLLIGSLVATVLSAGSIPATSILLLTAATAANKIVETYKQNRSEQDKIQQIPGFFYWDVTRNARKKERRG